MVTMVWVVEYNSGLRPLLVLHIRISPSTSSGQRNCASGASQPQKSVTPGSQPGGETTKSIRDMWWHWHKKAYLFINVTKYNKAPIISRTPVTVRLHWALRYVNKASTEMFTNYVLESISY
jgi:hypothetical protein